MKKNKKKRKIKTSFILTVLIIVILAILAFCIKDIFNSLTTKNQKEVEVLDTIKGYGYQLNENDSKYFKELFKTLKKELEQDNIDEEKYAELVSKLFITDFYSLDHVLNKNDVGGTQFVYKDYQSDFESYAKDSVYRYVENNISENRKQTLPDVKKVKVSDIKQDEYKSEVASDDEAYYVTLKITYVKDLEYPTECSLILIHSNDKLEIAAMNYDTE